MIKAILFDFDGTLVNSAPGIVKTMEQVFIKMNIPVPTEEAMRYYRSASSPCSQGVRAS